MSVGVIESWNIFIGLGFWRADNNEMGIDTFTINVAMIKKYIYMWKN